MNNYNFELMTDEVEDSKYQKEAEKLLSQIENNEFGLTLTQVMLIKGFYMDGDTFDTLSRKIGESRQVTKNIMYKGVRKIRKALKIPLY